MGKMLRPQLITQLVSWKVEVKLAMFRARILAVFEVKGKSNSLWEEVKY